MYIKIYVVCMRRNKAVFECGLFCLAQCFYCDCYNFISLQVHLISLCLHTLFSLSIHRGWTSKLVHFLANMNPATPTTDVFL